MEQHSLSEVLRRPITEGVKYGSIAGLIATWSISTAIAASELELGLPISTFYSIIGISLGSNDFIASAYLGFGLHLATGTILGAISGGLAVKVELRKSITIIFHPSIDRIIEILSLRQDNTVLSVFDSNNLGQSFRGIGISAVAFHIVWGAIFGFIISSLLRIRLSSALSSASSFMMQYRQNIGSTLRTVYISLVAGFISSLAISGLILLAEKINSLPVGTFYYVLISAITNSYSSNTESVIAIGLALHLIAGSFLGLVMSMPLIVIRNIRRASINKRISFY